ncbi:GSCOCG00003776001-RA-CDS [Cotesia congregata]|nr:GSCOCG00003776001-RA-CDS [Cotesia congregata]
MSKNVNLTKLEDFIVSRLWYTAYVAHKININNGKSSNDNNGAAIELCRSIGCYEYSSNSSWIIHKLLAMLTNKNVTEHQFNLLQLENALHLIDNHVPETVEQELLKLYDLIAITKEESDEIFPQITEYSLKFLEEHLWDKPAFVQWVIDQLLCIWSVSFAITDSALQDLYIKVIREIVNEAKNISASTNNNKTTNGLINCQKNINLISYNHLATLLSILSKFEITDSKEEELKLWLWPMLAKTCKFKDIELSLFSRKDLKYFKMWHTFCDDHYARNKSPDSLDDINKICSAVFDIKDESSDVSLNANEIFIRVLRNKTHWLSDILEICYGLVINNRFDQVEKLLKNPVLNNLWLPLLLKFIDNCLNAQQFSPNNEAWKKNSTTSESLKFLLKNCKFKYSKDQCMEEFESTLESHVDALEWIIKSRDDFFKHNKKSGSMHQNYNVRQIFRHLQSCSILSTIKTYVPNVHNKLFKDVYPLLKDSVHSKMTYRAYYGMLSALKAITLCNAYNTEFNTVIEHYNCMEKHVNNLNPLKLRLEVMENIFSMLFIRHEDFTTIENPSDQEDEDEDDNINDELPSYKNSYNYQTGFICNKYAIRETLHYLNRCIFVIDNEYARLRNDSKAAQDIEQLDKRISSMKRYLSDASWRLQLLTSTEFFKKQGLPDTELQNKNTCIVKSKINSVGHQQRTSHLYKLDESSSDEGELRSDIDVSSESSSIGNAAGENSKRRRRLKKLSSQSEDTSNEKSSKQVKEFTLSYMLASKETLVLRCLWKDNLTEAQRVIETFNMENNHLAGEILFSQAIRAFRQDIAKQLTLILPKNEVKIDTKHSTLDFIRQAAKDGIQTTRMTSQVETFLASQESNIKLSSDSSNAKDIMTLMTLDLALTMSQDSLTSENFAEIAMKHLKSNKKLIDTQYYEFFETIYQLFHEKKGTPIVNILCDARIPFSLKEYREQNDYWSNLARKLIIFENKTKLIDFIKDPNEEEKFKNDLQQILSVCSNGEPYLHRLNAHLELIRSIAPPFKDINAIGMKPSLLENSLDSYIGYQIFDLDVDLETLEIVANQLQVNLAYCILINCCPKLLCSDNLDNFEIKNNRWGIIVLNKYEIVEKFINDDMDDPNQCVVGILSDLIQAIKDSDYDSSNILGTDLKSLSKTESIQKILKKTQSFANLDLSYLSFGDHTLAFFLNIWNLIMLHIIIEIWSKDPPTSDLRHAVSLSTIGYEIGDLGFVSLFTLRSKLLGQPLCSDESLHFEYPEELNEPAWQDLDLQLDPRVIFAMINEYKRSPIIKIYHPEDLNEEINTTVHDYLNNYINQDKESVVCLPKLIKKYVDLLISTNGSKEIIEKYLSIDKNVEYESFKYLYDIRFKYSDEKPITNCDKKNNKNDKDSTTLWRNRVIKPSLLQYLEGHCWLLSYLVQRIHEESPTIRDSSCDNLDRTAVLENLFKSPWAQNLKALYEDNSTVAGLLNCSSTVELWDYFEALLKNRELKKCLTMLDALPDSLLMGNVEFQSFRDKILMCLISNIQLNLNSTEILQYLYQIRDIYVLAQVVLSKVKTWPVRVCEEALRHVLNHVDTDKLPPHCRSEISEILCRVLVFDKMFIYCKLDDDTDQVNWYNVVYRTEKTDPTRIVKSLIDANQYELCLEWMEYQTPSSEIQCLVSQDLFMGLLKNEKDNFKHARQLLCALPASLSIKLCNGIIDKLESINSLKFIIKYLLDNSPVEREKYQRGLLGVEILEQLDPRDRPLYIHLINEPLLMFEQLLMNCKFDNLQKILKTCSETFYSAGITCEEFDCTIRFYAQKSLDFRVAIQRDTDSNKLKENSLSQSEEFFIPVNIPTREEWIPDDKARECSCCKAVIFSMFNRRHHCRRCGRVVCANCSSQRIRVPGYADSVLVRVCNDCKRQTAMQAQGASSAPSSETFDCWRLSIQEAHNRTLREEFCFEYAPNIPLCLAILNLHSDHKTYATFLLDRCDEMKKLLYPDKKGRVNPEIDHSLIIKMIRSLLLAAKVKCAKLGLNTGLTDCDRFLSQVDLINILVSSDCLSLIPQDDLNDHTLRRLRDLLTEKEQWRLALNVSTKSGLDTQGVWAAWGKACLKVGYYEKAREKFSHCLDKVNQEDYVPEDWVLLSYSSDTGEGSKSDKNSEKRESSRTRTGLKIRPTKDPPLLVEILQILEVSNSTDQYSQQPTPSKNSMAQEILNTLNNLKAISYGNYTVSKLNSNTNNFRYQESLYYLLMYGSYNSILEFFVRYRELDKCLSYILENEIDPELFFNVVFLGCLRSGIMINLCTAIKSKDPSLLSWKKYLLFTCHNLERKQLFNTLYQLQLFMKDYVRAAMTCIRFYVIDASSYADICMRSHFLLDAQRHLEAELHSEKDEIFDRRQRRSVSSFFMDPSEIDKHINTISRQMEIAKFLGSCEKEGRSVNEFLSKLSFMDSEGLQPRNAPTLFGNQQERTHLAVLAILCGRNVEEGFGIAFRVMQDYNLHHQKVYSLVGHILALDKKINSIEQLIKCCRSSGSPNSNAISDRVLVNCIKFLLDRSRTETNPAPKDQIDSLIRLITDIELKIGCYIESKQLKAAYLLAVKHSREQDIRRILKEADSLGQSAIKSICTKWLQHNRHN